MKALVSINRRSFVALTVWTLGGCAASHEPGAAAPEGRWVSAGPASAFAADGVYAGTRDSGFFVIREGAQLYALSAICTHRTCKLRAKPDHSFFCPCHGSRFDLAGH